MAAASCRFARHPRWVVGHVLVLAAVVSMVLLGRWQLDVSNSKHFNLQNLGYALQWRALSIFAPSEGSQPAEAPAAVDEPVTYRRYVMPNQLPDADPEMVRYNAYLAALADQDSKP